MNLLQKIRSRFTPSSPLEPGIHQRMLQKPDGVPYRVHLRLHPDGSGLLILNAATVLHLNQTAAEYAWHFIQGTPAEEVGRQIARRYRTSAAQAQADYRAFRERLETLAASEDLDPVAYLGLERIEPGRENLTAPLRLDCALTYRLRDDGAAAPQRRVERELTSGEWKGILESAWASGIPHVTFTGGEPTLRPDLVELVQHAETLGMVTGLLTDGRSLTGGPLLEELLQAGLDHLLVLLDGTSSAWETISRIAPEDIFLNAHITISAENARQVPEWIEKLAEAGVNGVSLTINAPELEPALQTARDRLAEVGLPLTWDLPVPYSGFNPVALETFQGLAQAAYPGPWLYVEPDGDVLPAQGMPQHVLGNALHADWQTLWQAAQKISTPSRQGEETL